MLVERKFRLPRIWSNQELEKIAPLFSGTIVNVSGWKDQDKQGKHYKNYFSNATSYDVTNYGGFRGSQENGKDIQLDLEAPLPSELNNKFDTVFNHTTLEHVFEVRTAFKNLCLMSKDIVIVVVPFAQTQHEHENIKDYWRFTPTCLHRLFEENQMNVIYEAANDHKNAGTYVIMVGSKNPDIWKNKMPAYQPLQEIAWLLGASPLQRLKRKIKQTFYAK